MRCKIRAISDMDAYWYERDLLVGLEGEMFDDEFFEYDEITEWATGYFDCDEEVGIEFPIFFTEVQMQRLYD